MCYQLAESSDEVAMEWLDGEHSGCAEKFPLQTLISAIRQVTTTMEAIPVLCASSFQNIGVQPLLDAVIHYLPSPNDISHSFT